MHKAYRRYFSKKICLVLLTVFGITGGTVSASGADNTAPELLSTFRFMRSIIPPPENGRIIPDKSGCLAIRLDEEFYSQINDLSSDLRIVNAQSRHLPFALRQLTQEGNISREEQLPGRIVREQQLPDGRSAVDFELENPALPVSAIEISGRQLTGGMTLSIAVGDGSSWQTAVDQLKLTDLTAYPEITVRRFALPRKFFGKTIRLILNNSSTFPKLEAVRIYTCSEISQPNSAVTTQYQLPKPTAKQTPEMLLVTLNSNNLPLTQLKIRSNQPHYYHRLTIAGSHDQRNWQTITSAAIRKIDMDCADTVDFPESRYKYLQLQFSEPGNLTAENLQIAAFGNCYNLLVTDDAAARQPLTVFYGAAVKPPAAPRLELTPGEPHLAGYFHLNAPAANSLRKTGVGDRSSWPFLLGALLVAMTGIIIIWTVIELKHSSTELPAD